MVTGRSLRTLVAAAIATLVITLASTAHDAAQSSWLSAAETIAPGVEYFTSTDATLISPAGPTAVSLLKLDPARVAIDSVHAKHQIMGLEPVDAIARSHNAIAAVNAGFFNTKNGDPSTVLKIAGELVSDTSMTRGVVVINSPKQGRTTLEFDQLGARQTLHFVRDGKELSVPIDGIDTTRARGKLMMYTPMYHADSDTAPTGTEWVVSGTPLTVTDVRSGAGHTPIPSDGFVLSYGGVELAAPLSRLRAGTAVTLTTHWISRNGLAPAVLDAAEHIVNGAGLLRRQGRVVTDWSNESLSGPTFLEMRHPRTVIGVDNNGFIWLIAIDGRQPDRASGMNFAELQALCDRLQLTDALNLDGGGSTSMVVKGEFRNRPSDPAGPRPVSDALLVSIR